MIGEERGRARTDDDAKDEEALRREVRELRRQLAEAENTVEALLAGEIDSVADPSDEGGAQVLLRRAQEELRASERALQQSTERLRTVLDHLPVGVLVVDPDGEPALHNPEAARIWGEIRPVGQSPVRRGRWLDTDEAIGAEEWPLARALHDGETTREAAIELDIDEEGDETRLTVQSAAPIVDGEGEVLGAVGVTQDVTEFRRLQQRVQQARKMEAVGQLAGGIAHEFNNLLMAILGHAELLSQTLGDDHPGQEDIAVIEQSGRRAADLTRQLLAYGRKQVFEPRALDPNQVIEGLAPVLRRTLGETIDVEVRLDPDAGRVRADPAQLEQVALALALNARDAMPEGGRLILEVRDLPADETRRGDRVAAREDFVCLEISDTGAGMDEETQERIFDPFFTTKATGEGTGLGLSTVLGIVEQSGGHIRVSSAPGEGSTFTIMLPRTGEETAGPDRQGAAPAEGGGETVLVAEDEGLARDVVCRALERAGYRVLDADSPERALEIADEHRDSLDVLVSDVVMPGMNGPELARRMREGREGLAVLFISGYADDEALRDRLPRRSAFVSKPISPAELTTKVRALLDRRDAPDG